MAYSAGTLYGEGGGVGHGWGEGGGEGEGKGGRWEVVGGERGGGRSLPNLSLIYNHCKQQQNSNQY